MVDCIIAVAKGSVLRSRAADICSRYNAPTVAHMEEHKFSWGCGYIRSRPKLSFVEAITQRCNCLLTFNENKKFMVMWTFPALSWAIKGSTRRSLIVWDTAGSWGLKAVELIFSDEIVELVFFLFRLNARIQERSWVLPTVRTYLEMTDLRKLARRLSKCCINVGCL